MTLGNRDMMKIFRGTAQEKPGFRDGLDDWQNRTILWPSPLSRRKPPSLFFSFMGRGKESGRGYGERRNACYGFFHSSFVLYWLIQNSAVLPVPARAAQGDRVIYNCTATLRRYFTPSTCPHHAQSTGMGLHQAKTRSGTFFFFSTRLKLNCHCAGLPLSLSAEVNGRGEAHSEPALRPRFIATGHCNADAPA